LAGSGATARFCASQGKKVSFPFSLLMRPLAAGVKPCLKGRISMTRRDEDEAREERISMEIIVDANGPEEQAMGWYLE